MDHPVDELGRQCAIVAFVDCDVADFLVLDDMLVEEAVERAAFGACDGGEVSGGVGSGVGRSDLHVSLLLS